MSKHRPKRTRDGRWIDDYVVEDGGEVRVPAYLADGWRGDLVRRFGATDTLDAHRPGYRLPSNLARDVVREARQEMIDRATSGWLMDKRRDGIHDRDAWVTSLADQWRVPASLPKLTTNLPHGHPVRDVCSAGPGPAKTLPPDESDDQAKRDAAWKPGHRAGRPRKPPEEFHPSVWEHGRCEIAVLDRRLAEALRANSSHCAIAFAIRDAIPEARRIAVDLQTIRWSLPKRGVRYVFLTPHVAQQDVIIPFDQGEECHPVTFKMKPAWITRTGAKRNHTPEPEQLRGTGLRVADEQLHISEQSKEVPNENFNRTLIPYAGKEPRKPYKPRRPRAMISATKPDGSIPVTLGGKLPPKSVLARREFGLRVLARREFGLRQVRR
jgi:hypothetical protein